MGPNAAVQPQIRAQREFVGWNCLLDPDSPPRRVLRMRGQITGGRPLCP
jgi:hypothetical protein